MLAVVRAIAAVDDSDAFGRVVLGELDRVVPFDFGAVDELDPRAKQVRATTHPTDVSRPPWGWEVYARYAPQNPVIEYVQRTGDGSARRVSDFITQAELHRLGLYEHVFAPVGIEYQIGWSLPARRPLLIGMALGRSHRDFDDDERDLLNALRPHLIQAYRSAQIRSTERTALRSLAFALETQGRAVLVLDRYGSLDSAEASARALLARHFDSNGDGRLPGEVEAWLSEERSALRFGTDGDRLQQPLVRHREGERLVLRFVPGAPGAADVVLLDERSIERDAAPLRELGLTSREAEILWWLTRGESVGLTASRLGVRPSTVRKHLEGVYRKLGVSSRAAATAQAIDALNWYGPTL